MCTHGKLDHVPFMYNVLNYGTANDLVASFTRYIVGWNWSATISLIETFIETPTEKTNMLINKRNEKKNQ